MEDGKGLEIEKAAYEEFLAQWHEGRFQQQRLGQAFYNFFDLHKLADQTFLHTLYDADGKKAITLIQHNFNIS